MLEELYRSYIEWQHGEYGAPLSIREFEKRLVFHDVRVKPGVDWPDVFYTCHYDAPVKLVS